MRRRFLIGASALILAAGLALPTGALADDAADEAAIRDIWTAYASAAVAGDADTWLALWDPEGMRFPPGADGMSYEVFSKGIPANFAASTTTAMEIDPTEIQIMGDWAYALGTYTKDWVADGADVHLDGKFMTILKRADDGGWRLYRDIFNASPSK